MPNFREIIQDIRKRNFAPVYILMGEEAFYIDKIVEALENSVVASQDKEFDQSIMYGADSNAAMVLESAGRYPMLSEKRLVLLKEAQSMHTAKNQIDKLKGCIEKPNPTVVLAIVFKGDKLNATSDILKAAKKNKDVVVFESAKVRDYQLVGIIKDFCMSEKITIEDKAADILAAHVGVSLSNLYSEIDKLKLIVGQDKKITADMVNDLIGVSREFNNFELTSALARKSYFDVINIVTHFENNPKANPTQQTAAVLFNFFQKLVLAAFAADKSEKGLMDTLRLKSPYQLREIREGLRHYNASQLVQAIHAIRQFDRKSKGIDSMQKEFPLLKELVCRLVTM